MCRPFDVAMKFKRRFWLLALVPVAALVWAMKSAASWRPQVVGVQKGANFVSLAPDGRTLLVCNEMGEGQMWNTNTQLPLFKINGANSAVFSPDSASIAIADATKPDSVLRISLFDGGTGKLKKTLKHSTSWRKSGLDDSVWDNVYEYQFSANSNDVFLVMDSGDLIWNVATGKEVTQVKWKITGSDKIDDVRFGRLLPDKELFVGWGHSKLKIFDVHNGKQLRILPIKLNRGHFYLSPDGYSLWTGERGMSSFRLSDGKPLWNNPKLPQFSPDGKLAYVLASDALEVLDAHTGRKLKTLPGPTSDNFAPSPDGNWIYEARGGKIWKWRAR